MNIKKFLFYTNICRYLTLLVSLCMLNTGLFGFGTNNERPSVEHSSIDEDIAVAWQINVNRIDPSPQPSGGQMLFRMQLQVSAINENAAYNSEVRFPAQDPSYFTIPTTHPTIESFYFDAIANEWVIDLQDVILAGTNIEFDIMARSPNHTTPNGTVVEIDATISSDNTSAVSSSDSGTWSASADLGVEKYLEFGPNTDALLDIPVKYYLYPCDPSFAPNSLGHLYIENWSLVDQLPPGTVYNGSSGTYDAVAHTVTWSDVAYLENEECDYEGPTDYWIEVTFPSTVFGASASPPVLEVTNTATFEAYPIGEAVTPANRLYDTDALLHGFGLPNPLGSHTKSAVTPYYGTQDITYEGEGATFYVNIRTSSASTTPYYFKIIDPMPCLDYTPNASTQYESTIPGTTPCGNPAYQPTDLIRLSLYHQYLSISDTASFRFNNPTIPLNYIGTNGVQDTIHVPYKSTGYSTIVYEIPWADVQSQIGAGIGISSLIWDSESIGVVVPTTSFNLRTAAQLALIGDVAEDTPAYPMLNQYRVRNYSYFYVRAAGQEDSLGFIQDDVIIFDEAPSLRAQKSVGESSGLITLTANSSGGNFRSDDSLIIADLLPIGYTFKEEAQQYMQFVGGGSWYWSQNQGFYNQTIHSEFDGISVQNYIDVEVIDDYNGTGRQLVRATFLPPPKSTVWDDLTSFRFSFYVNESPMNYSATNTMRIYPTNPVSVSNLRCQSSFSSYPQVASSNDTDDWDGDGLTAGDGFCYDDDNVQPSSTIVDIQAHKAVRGDFPVGSGFEGFPTVAGITDLGGSADFQINITNRGGVALEDLVIYDVLPHIGDTGISEGQISTARGSAFDVTFTGVNTSNLPPNTQVQYSTSTNACRNELTTGATPFPTGCVNNWTNNPPSPIGNVKALRFSFTGQTDNFNPGESISIEYGVTYPSGILPGEVAWNNFAYAANRADDNSAILPTELPKVGIAIPQADLAVTKTVSPTLNFVGEAAEYTLLITHEGEATSAGVYTLPASTAYNITLTDNFKAQGLTLVPGSVVIANTTSGLENGVTFDTTNGSIFIPEMGPNDAYEITYSAYRTTGSSITNTLEIMSHPNIDDVDSSPGNGILSEDDMDDATASWIEPSIDLRKLVESSPNSGMFIEADASDGLSGEYAEGEPITYRFIVKNTGPISLWNLSLEDDLTGFECNFTHSFLNVGDSIMVDCEWPYGYLDSPNPYVNTATVTANRTLNGVEIEVSDTDSAQVIIVPCAQPYIGNNQTVCSGEVLTLVAFPSQADQSDSIRGNWQIGLQSGSTANQTLFSNDSLIQLILYADASGPYVDTVYFYNACNSVDTILVTVNPAPTYSARDTTVCPNEIVDLTSLVPNYGNILNPTWHISTVNGSIENTPTGISVNTATSYFLIGNNANGCLDTTQLTVSTYALPNPSLSDVTICSDGTATLSPGTFTQYAWSSSEVTPTVDKGAGTYTVTVTNANGCTASATATITEILTCIDVSSDQTALCVGGSATLTAVVTGGVGTCNLQWQYLDGSNWVDVVGETGLTFNVPAIVADRSYRVARTCNGTGCGTLYSGEVFFNVD